MGCCEHCVISCLLVKHCLHLFTTEINKKYILQQTNLIENADKKLMTSYKTLLVKQYRMMESSFVDK